jgi:hypothetical protein
MTQILQKELRTLAFPAGVALAAVLAGVWAASVHDLTLGTRTLLTRAAIVAFSLGPPFLASLPFGSEFQHKTIVLLLSAPVSRGRIWFHKWLAATLVLVTLTAIVVLAFMVLRWPVNAWPIVPALMFMVMAACAAPLWTLVARSTIGGLTFTLWSILMVEIAASWVTFRWNPGPTHDLFGRSPWLDAVRVLYAVVTLYAGYAVFSRFQVAATGVGAATAVQSDTGVRLLRARPSGAIANIIRKELVLQRPAFLMAVLFTAGGIVSIGLMTTGAVSIGVAEALPVMLFAGYMPLVIVLAGTIPVGEETSLGIRDWHMTLPVSARTQWLLKMLVAVGVVILLGLVLPAVLTSSANRLTGGKFGDAATFRSPSFQLIVIGATLLAFWSSTMFGDTLRSSLATGAAVVALGVCSALGSNFGHWLPFRLTWWVPLTIRYQLPAYYLQAVWLPGIMTTFAAMVATAVGLPQSLAAFRRVRVSPRTALRNCAVLFAVILGIATIVSNTMEGMFSRKFWPGREVSEAVMNLPGLAEQKYDDPARAVTVEELDAARRLSPETRRWLANATITVDRLALSGTPAYRVKIQFPNGFDDRFIVRLPR